MAIDAARLGGMAQRERERYARERPRSAELAAASRAHWLHGVPLHWMQDWGTPFPLFVREARGARLLDADGHAYADFCLGDSGALFGHAPEPVARALAAQAARGLTAMLPGERVAAVGALLAERFGLPYWQLVQTATEANRAVLRYARAATGRRRVLVFDGCYHGTVDETMVRLREGRTVARAGQVGAPFELAAHSVAVPFNDVAALEQALAARDIACVLAEPVMTNAGMVLPQPGFLDTLRRLTRAAGTLLAIDETHTLSSGLGGYARVHGLAADFLVCGKAVAGGMPCAVYGFSADVEAALRRVWREREGGHSGLGTTLSANLLALAALEATLSELMTPAAYTRMERLALRLELGLEALLRARAAGWHVARVGARLELGFGAAPPRNAVESEAAMHPELEHALHLYLLNRGVLLTPFHNMMLLSPATQDADVDRLLAALDAALAELA
ncbi:MAG: transaminase [Steroidobacteraceae bacterium]